MKDASKFFLMASIPTHFFGLTVEPGKTYTQQVDEDFHLSMVKEIHLGLFGCQAAQECQSLYSNHYCGWPNFFTLLSCA